MLGCVDPAATNFNSEATNDDGSCEYSTSYLLNGEWMIVSLNTLLKLTCLMYHYWATTRDQELDGEANDAGVWTFQYPEYIYNNNLNFDTGSY